MVAKVLFVLLCGVSTLALLQALEIKLMRKVIEEYENGRKERNG